MTHYHIEHVYGYKCSCGKEFNALSNIWDHLENERVNTKCPDCAAYQETLKLLRRARDIMLTSNDHYLIGFIDLLNDIKKQCPTLDEIE